jgi:hypothetical protein
MLPTTKDNPSPRPPLSAKEARALAKQIVKDGKNVRVKPGVTNGKNVLHVWVPGRNDLGVTIDSAAQWDLHPANERVRRNSEMAELESTEKLMESNSPERAA